MLIGTRNLATDPGVYVIAELGVNHDGSLQRALELVDAAKLAGVDAVKLQFFRAGSLMSRSSRLAEYQAKAGESDPAAMLERLELSVEDMGRVVDRAHSMGLHAIVTCFSTELVGVAQELPFDAYKTASPDIIHKPLLLALSATGKPVIVSTGASTLDEVRRALDWLAPAHDRLALLQCVSCYPVSAENASIAGMCDLARCFDGPIGYSDHTPDQDTSTIAYHLGARVLEKHLTYDRAAKGPDHGASLDLRGMAEYVMQVRDVPRELERVPRGPALPTLPAGIAGDVRLGTPVKRVLACEEDVRAVSRQSVVATRDLEPGHVLSRDDLTIKRPGTGIPPYELDGLVGRRLADHVYADTLVRVEDLA
jgi:sialic acid synthase SpsE